MTYAQALREQAVRQVRKPYLTPRLSAFHPFNFRKCDPMYGIIETDKNNRTEQGRHEMEHHITILELATEALHIIHLLHETELLPIPHSEILETVTAVIGIIKVWLVG